MKIRIWKRIFYSVIAIVGSLGFSLAPINKVFATSAYDDAYQTTSDVDIHHVSCGGNTDNTVTLSAFAIGYFLASDPTYGAAFTNAVKTGQVGVSNFTHHYDLGGGVYRNSIQVSWTGTGTPNYSQLSWGSFGAYRYVVGTMYGNGAGSVFIDAYNDTSNNCALEISSGTNIISDNDSVKNVIFQTTSPNYPTGYAGASIVGSEDEDEDGLTVAQEVLQNTSDNLTDTDGDGLSDFIESVWNPNHDAQFCNTSSPKNCAEPDPATKDLFLQIDWSNDGTNTYKPSTTQLDLVDDKFAAMGIRLHVDAGEYGGGNELSLPGYKATVDVRDEFFGYKWGYETEDPANFSEDRYHIWHYMIAGYNFTDGESGSETSSGKAENGGDDSFLSLGLLEDVLDPADLDNAVAGTIMHELGHNLCLSKVSYGGQDSSCLFTGVDNDGSANYHSAMNYAYQFTNAYAYSDGTHGTGDHDDISAIDLGFDDFLGDDDSGVGGPS